MASSCGQPIILGFDFFFFFCSSYRGFEVQFEGSIVRFSCFLDGINLGSKLLLLGACYFFYNWFKPEGIGDWFLDLWNSI